MDSIKNEKLESEKVYPDLSEDNIERIEEDLRRYLAIAWQVFERIRLEKRDVLTEFRSRARLRKRKKALK